MRRCAYCEQIIVAGGHGEKGEFCSKKCQAVHGKLQEGFCRKRLSETTDESMGNNITVFGKTLLLTIVLCIASNAAGQPTLPKSEIAENLSKEIREEILLLYSTDAAERGNAAMQLREFRANALRPATPYLLGMLHDDAPLVIPGRCSW